MAFLLAPAGAGGARALRILQWGLVGHTDWDSPRLMGVYALAGRGAAMWGSGAPQTSRDVSATGLTPTARGAEHAWDAIAGAVVSR